jgi:retron-type reverse transcriptase
LKNNCLFENRYGFRPGRSCEHALLNAQSSILHSLDNNQIALLLLLDYNKAFDVIDHVTILNKLEHYGIRGPALKWFKSYLTGRTQFVSVNGTNSLPKPIIHGAPQGCILGPLLFVMCIHDLPGISKFAKFIPYVDDANIIIIGSNILEINTQINRLTNVLIQWVNSNGLALNFLKENFVHDFLYEANRNNSITGPNRQLSN